MGTVERFLREPDAPLADGRERTSTLRRIVSSRYRVLSEGDLTFSKEWTHDDPFQSCRSSIWRDCSQAVCPMTGKQSEAHLDLAQWTSVEAVAMGGILAGVRERGTRVCLAKRKSTKGLRRKLPSSLRPFGQGDPHRRGHPLPVAPCLLQPCDRRAYGGASFRRLEGIYCRC